MMVELLVSILVVFSVGRGQIVDMPLGSWIGAALLRCRKYGLCSAGLILASYRLVQLMSVVGSLLSGLAVLDGLWMPITLFPDWMQAIRKCLPTYQLMEFIRPS